MFDKKAVYTIINIYINKFNLAGKNVMKNSSTDFSVFLNKPEPTHKGRLIQQCQKRKIYICILEVMVTKSMRLKLVLLAIIFMI